MVNSETGIRQVVDFIEFGMDEEVQANSAKIIRIALREDSHFDKVCKEASDLGNTLLKNCTKLYFSEVVLTELLAAIRNYSRVPSKLTQISKLLFNIVIKIAKMPASEKLQ